MAEVLGEDDLRRVVNALHKMRAQWKDIGLQLGVEVHDLDDIRSSSRTQSKLIKMLTLWLRSTPSPTWWNIVDALRHPSVNRLNVAEEVRRKYCPEYDPQPISLNPPPQPGLDPEGQGSNKTQITSEKSVDKPSKPISCTRGQLALFMTVITLCAVFAFGGVTLITVGIRGFADDEDYTCSLGPSDAFNSLNLITGVGFLSGVIISLLSILYLCYRTNERIKKIIKGIIIGFIAGSLILIVADVIYAFYVASHVLPNVAEWERNKTLCGSPVFRSSFGIIVTYFLIMFSIAVAGAVFLAWLIFTCTKWIMTQHNCFKSEHAVDQP
jgi:hypothetical protein